MQENLLNINKLLLSGDEGLREMGRLYIDKLPASTDKLHKSILLMNSNNKYMLFKGAQIFLTFPRSVKTLKELLSLLNEVGNSYNSRVAVSYIMENYKRVKKLQSFFSQVDLVSEILTKEPISISKFD